MVEEWTPPAPRAGAPSPRENSVAELSSKKGNGPKSPTPDQGAEDHRSERKELREGLVQSLPLLLLGGVAVVIGFLASAGLLHGWNLGPTFRELLILAGVVAVSGGLVGSVLPDTEPQPLVCPACGAAIPARASAEAPAEKPPPAKLSAPEPRGEVGGSEGRGLGDGPDWDEGAESEPKRSSTAPNRREEEVPIFREDDEDEALPPSESGGED